MKLSKSLSKTVIHGLEVAFCVMLGFGIILSTEFLFGISLQNYAQDIASLGISVVLSMLAKFARVSPKIPVKDYVNE